MNRQEENFLRLLESAVDKQDLRTLALVSALAGHDEDLLLRAVRSLPGIKKLRLSCLLQTLVILRKSGKREWVKAFIFVEKELYRFQSCNDGPEDWDNFVRCDMHGKFAEAYFKELIL